MPINFPQFNQLNVPAALQAGTQNALGTAQLIGVMQQNKLRNQLAPIQVQTAQQNLQNSQLNNQIGKLNYALTQLKTVNDQKSYDALRNNIAATNPQFAQTLPDKYDPVFMNKFTGALSNQLDIQQKQMGLKTGQINLDIMQQRQQMLQNYLNPKNQQNNPQSNSDFSNAYKQDVVGNLLGIKNPALDKYVQTKIQSGYMPNGQLDPAVTQAASAIANYQEAPLTGRAAGSPQARALMAEVLRINPNYNSNIYHSRQAALTGFGSGKQGDTVRSLNVAVQHLDLLDNLVNALGSGDVNAWNKAKVFYKRQTGSPAPTNFNSAKQIVADEIAKAVIGGQAAQQDREELSRNLDAANSFDQLHGVISTLEGLMHGQLSGLRTQYINSTGRTSEDFDKKLNPRTIKVLSQFEDMNGAKSNSPQNTLQSQDQQAVEWAKQNPNDPRSAQILKINGIQ